MSVTVGIKRHTDPPLRGARPIGWRKYDIGFGKNTKIDPTPKVERTREIRLEKAGCCVFCGLVVEVVASRTCDSRVYYSFRRAWDAFGRDTS